MSRFEIIPGMNSELSDEEAEHILNRVNSIIDRGFTGCRELTPEVWEEMKRNREARQKQKELERAKSANNSKVE